MKKLFLAVTLLVLRVPIARADDEEFRQKLGQMLSNIEKSVTILKTQIHESKHAAFLPDLTFQLGSLYEQKSMVLYYIQMERIKMSGSDSGMTEATSAPVIAAQKEANEQFTEIIENFPQYEKLPDVMYSLAVGLHAIDERPRFMATVQRIRKEYAGSEQAIRATILLGQSLMTRGLVPQAIEQWQPIADSQSATPERERARYYMGTALIRSGKDAEALKYLEQVAKSDLLGKEASDQISLDRTKGSTDLRRDALIDSVIPFTNVHGVRVDALAYYAALAPNEVVLQEVYEKLAFRYAFLKQYDRSIKILRALSQRMRDVQKIVVIYADVLRLIPLESRLDISVSEMKYVLERLNYWRSYFTPDTALRERALAFFELQLRELGTRAHAECKKNPKNDTVCTQAEENYKLYLTYFSPSDTAGKISANLGDLYMLRKDFLNCGNSYLDAFQGVWGEIPDGKPLLRNALYCLDQKTEASFYQQTRKRGLLIRGIEELRKVEPKEAATPEVQFAYARAVYDNGERERGLGLFKSFIQENPKSQEAIVAGEIILDHYNKTDDFSGLSNATQFLMKAGLSNTAFIKRVEEVQKSAAQKMLEEKVKTFSGGDEFAQGRSYLQAALSSEDGLVKSAAISEALQRSRTEGDFNTFRNAAMLMAANEKNTNKKAEILLSLAYEQRKLLLLSESYSTYTSIFSLEKPDEKTRIRALEGATEIALLGRDTRYLAELSGRPEWRLLGGAARQRVRELVGDMLTSPVEISGDLSEIMMDDLRNEGALTAFVQAQERLPSRVREALPGALAAVCSRGRQRPLCRWRTFFDMEPSYAALRKELMEGSRSPQRIEPVAREFQSTWNRLRDLQGSRDAALEAAVVIRCRWLFTHFAKYLEDVGAANADLREVLAGKVRETRDAAEKYRKGCLDLARTAAVASPALRQCDGTSEPTAPQLVAWRTKVIQAGIAAAKPTVVAAAQKALLANPASSQAQLDLSEIHLRAGNFHHAAAAATLGAQGKENQEGFRVLLGCASAELGLWNEALFHLNKSGDFKGLKASCLQKIR